MTPANKPTSTSKDELPPSIGLTEWRGTAYKLRPSGRRGAGLPVSSAMLGCVLSEQACSSVCGGTALYRR
jgi:hypothetical protein